MSDLTEHEQYLGDGVYASFDGYHTILDLRGQDNTTRIALEPAVMDALIGFRASLVRAKAAQASDAQKGGDHEATP